MDPGNGALVVHAIGLEKLRSELDALQKLDDWEQFGRVEQLRALYPHSIRPLGFGPPHEALFERRREFNCIAFAFQLVVWPGFFERRQSPVAGSPRRSCKRCWLDWSRSPQWTP